MPDANIKSIDYINNMREFCNEQCKSGFKCVEECGLQLGGNNNNYIEKEFVTCAINCLHDIINGLPDVCNSVQANVINSVLLLFYLPIHQ